MATKPNKTLPTAASVATFVAAIADPKRRKDCVRLIALMKKATAGSPVGATTD